MSLDAIQHSATLVMSDPAALARFILSADNPWSRFAALLAISASLMALYGLMMGVRGGYRQMLASAAKTPLLFVLTLLICLPVLYMINAQLGSRLDLPRMATLMLSGMAMTALVLTSIAPIVGFFGVSSEYQFMKLAHVAVFGLASLAGVGALAKGMIVASESGFLAAGAGLTVFNLWIVVYAFVGCQMAWFLRPFLGDPNLPFQFLRQPEPGMNFYMAVLKAFRIVNSSKPGSETSRWAEEGAEATPTADDPGELDGAADEPSESRSAD